MNETTLTITGNLTTDPELRFTPSGTAVANLTVAATPRRFDKTSGGWVDGEALFLRCTVWRQAAENVAESLTRGARVVVTGRLRSSTFETREGDKRTTLELDVERHRRFTQVRHRHAPPRPAHQRRHGPAHRHRRTTVLIRLACSPSHGGAGQAPATPATRAAKAGAPHRRTPANGDAGLTPA